MDKSRVFILKLAEYIFHSTPKHLDTRTESFNRSAN